MIKEWTDIMTAQCRELGAWHLLGEASGDLTPNESPGLALHYTCLYWLQQM